MDKTKPVKIWKKLGFKSEEEMEFSFWLEEAEEKGWISNPVYQPESFLIFPEEKIQIPKKLKTKTRMEWKTFVRSHSYTADWKFEINDTAPSLIKSFFTHFEFNPMVWVDVKGEMIKKYKYGGQNNEKFSLDQKAVWFFHKIWVFKVIPVRLFKATFVPEKAVVMKGRKTRTVKKKYVDCLLVDDLDKIHNCGKEF